MCLRSYRAAYTQRPTQAFNTLEKQSADNQDPLYRLFYREGSIGRKLLLQVRRDLADVIKVCEGELKQTNHLRMLISSLTKGETKMRRLREHATHMIVGTIPSHWRQYKVNKSMAVTGWIADFARRLKQLAQIATLDNLSNVEVWLGGLFFPEAYITATRQAVAHRKKWSLETLRLRLDIERVNDPEAFIVDGMCLTSTAVTISDPASQVLFSRALTGPRTSCCSTTAKLSAWDRRKCAGSRRKT